MTQDTPANDGPAPPEDGSSPPTASDRTPGVLTAWLVQYDDGLDELTLAPRDCPPAGRLTTWISAQDGSFVHLEDLR